MCHLLRRWTKLGSQSLTIRPVGRRSSGVTAWGTPWFVLASEIERGPQPHARWEEFYGKNVSRCPFFNSMLTFCVALLLVGWLWWPSAVPGGAWPLGGPRHRELRSNRMHGGEQAQCLHSHRSLHPMDRGHTHQGLLLALSSNLKEFLVHIFRHRKSRYSKRLSALSRV